MRPINASSGLAPLDSPSLIYPPTMFRPNNVTQRLDAKTHLAAGQPFRGAARRASPRRAPRRAGRSRVGTLRRRRPSWRGLSPRHRRRRDLARRRRLARTGGHESDLVEAVERSGPARTPPATRTGAHRPNPTGVRPGGGVTARISYTTRRYVAAHRTLRSNDRVGIQTNHCPRSVSKEQRALHGCVTCARQRGRPRQPSRCIRGRPGTQPGAGAGSGPTSPPQARRGPSKARRPLREAQRRQNARAGRGKRGGEEGRESAG